MPTDNEIVTLASAVIDVGVKVKQLNSLIDQVLSNNSAQSITWTDFDVGTATNALTGKDYTGTEISNVIGNINTFASAWYTSSVQGNIELIVPPKV